jgi:hypothetical protein
MIIVLIPVFEILICFGPYLIKINTLKYRRTFEQTDSQLV